MPTIAITSTTSTIISHRCKTNTVSNTAFRGFGGPQGMMAIEHVVDEIARYLGLDPLAVRKRNFYGSRRRNVTPYHMTVEDNVIRRHRRASWRRAPTTRRGARRSRASTPPAPGSSAAWR